ncbi:hypothetical protein [Streptomyces sp. NPDC102462]|uniref:hypothetical protein n=1 Tax=Streptomyces sp. NPDC102462 TaxID=3366178 RepID=UPI0038234767
MTTPPDPEHTPLFNMDVPVPLTPVERLLALADLYTQHNDRIDLLFSGHAHTAPDAYVTSAHRLEREALACIKDVRQQHLPAIEPVASAVVRLKQTAYLTSGATRYLAAAQQALPSQAAEHTRPDPRRGFGQLMRLPESPHPVLGGGTDLLAEIPHPQVADLRSGATREGPADSQPGPGAGRAVQGGRSPSRSDAEGALDRSARPAHSTSGRPRSPLPTATDWGTKSSPGRFQESSSQYVRLARELTALAPLSIVESASHIAHRLSGRARNSSSVPDLDAAQHNALLEVARGHITITEQHGHRVHGHTSTAAVEVLRHLEAQHLVTRQPASVPPIFPGGALRDRVRLTALGISTLSAVIDAPPHISLPMTRPVTAPAAANAARAHR